MDRYDAILEQLKQAQNHGLDSVETRLDAIVASLEELIQSAKAAVQDARLKDAEELLPLAEVEALLEEARAEAQVPPPPPPAPGITLDNLRNLDAARSQSELLRALLPMMAEHVGRAVVLVIRDGVVSAWSGIGFADGEKLRSWHGGVAVSPSFSELMENSKPTMIDPTTDPLLSEWLQEDVVPDEGVLLPISLRGKLMGIVYVDHHGNQPWNIEAAQSLNAVACWLIDTLHHRMTVPTPTVAVLASAEGEPYDAEVAVGETPEPPAEEEPDDGVSEEAHAVEFEFEGKSQDAIEIETVAKGDFEEPEVSGEPEPAEFDFEPEEAPTETGDEEEEVDHSATVQIDTAEEDVSPEPAEEEPPAEVAPPSTEVQPPVSEVEAPPPVRPVEPPPDIEAEPMSDEDARQEEARRFARLLVSEIKLYNEDEVERGRAERDLCTRLREDIDRSREMFEKRIPADVREGHDYFQDELIRILADGDADALGV